MIYIVFWQEIQFSYKGQNVMDQMFRDPAKAMELKDVKPGQGL